MNSLFSVLPTQTSLAAICLKEKSLPRNTLYLFLSPLLLPAFLLSSHLLLKTHKNPARVASFHSQIVIFLQVLPVSKKNTKKRRKKHCNGYWIHNVVSWGVHEIIIGFECNDYLLLKSLHENNLWHWRYRSHTNGSQLLLSRSEAAPPWFCWCCRAAVHLLWHSIYLIMHSNTVEIHSPALEINSCYFTCWRPA